ncbi:phosphonate ABC transporter ATP-binding protein [Pseudomonas aeruginosa VRFPA09]|nr:phosphonate ABC transporter ATP-binding protein [Pseudomonas aeruginosa VRFPA09]
MIRNSEATPDPDKVIHIPCADSFSVIVQLRDFNSHRLWNGNKLVFDGGHPRKSISIAYLGDEIKCQHRTTYDNVRFMLPRASIKEFLYEEGQRASAEPERIIGVRRQTLGYVSQFLRVIPRVATLDVVMEPALARGWSRDSAELRARSLLARLNIPERLWQLAPGTFSGGEQQRVNIARGFMVEWPILLLDEPTASLDEANRQVVLELIGEAKAAGAALIGIFHDRAAREAVASRYLDMSQELSRQEQAHVV